MSAILNERAGISPEMAIRLGKAFATSPESWMNQQAMYDLAIATEKHETIVVEELVESRP